MLKKEELYTEEISEATANSIYSEENRVKILLVGVLFFMILTLGYWYSISNETQSTIKGTRVLGVSYTSEEESKQEQQQKSQVEYMTKSDTSTLDDKEEYEEIVMVDDKDEYRDATVVDDKKEYTEIVTVKNPL